MGYFEVIGTYSVLEKIFGSLNERNISQFVAQAIPSWKNEPRPNTTRYGQPDLFADLTKLHSKRV